MGEDCEWGPNSHHAATVQLHADRRNRRTHSNQRAARESLAPAPSSSKHKFRKSKKSKRSDIAAYAPSGNGNPLDAAYDDDVPEWGRDYGAPKGSKRGGRDRSGTQNSYESSGYSANNGNGNAAGHSGAAGTTRAQENWDHQF
jgi:hypothetical protein